MVSTEKNNFINLIYKLILIDPYKTSINYYKFK